LAGAVEADADQVDGRILDVAGSVPGISPEAAAGRAFAPRAEAADCSRRDEPVALTGLVLVVLMRQKLADIYLRHDVRPFRRETAGATRPTALAPASFRVKDDLAAAGDGGQIVEGGSTQRTAKTPFMPASA
jgi:hypothetical protein